MHPLRVFSLFQSKDHWTDGALLHMIGIKTGWDTQWNILTQTQHDIKPRHAIKVSFSVLVRDKRWATVVLAAFLFLWHHSWQLRPHSDLIPWKFFTSWTSSNTDEQTLKFKTEITIIADKTNCLLLESYCIRSGHGL